MQGGLTQSKSFISCYWMLFNCIREEGYVKGFAIKATAALIQLGETWGPNSLQGKIQPLGEMQTNSRSFWASASKVTSCLVLPSSPSLSVVALGYLLLEHGQQHPTSLCWAEAKTNQNKRQANLRLLPEGPCFREHRMHKHQEARATVLM